MKRKAIAERLHRDHFPNFPKRKVYSMVNFIIKKLSQALLSGEKVKISGFGSFRRGEKRIVFRPSKKLLFKLKYGLKRSKI